VLNRHKVAKHFALTIMDGAFRLSRNTGAIAAERDPAVAKNRSVQARNSSPC